MRNASGKYQVQPLFDAICRTSLFCWDQSIPQQGLSRKIMVDEENSGKKKMMATERGSFSTG